MKGLNTALQLSALHLVATSASFQEVVDHVQTVEGVKQDGYVKYVEKKARYGGHREATKCLASQPEGSQAKAPGYGGYSISSVSIQRPMLDHGCFECREIGNFKRNYPRLRQGGQGAQFQAPKAPASGRGGGSYGGNRAQTGRGGHTAGRGGTQPNRGGFQSGRGGHQPGRGGAQAV
ncbi:glycine-rich RNA-binding protein blt801-like [Lycium ferocissimum]|uniref:glycine-rich RNA-binding protein blt801-like n=1 Tax=Lycium ferocissimum TaxID=112874 RepID=UPI0028162CB7|nr:glycine-rich RNA-binding protein blt801-like [Lycium ferocissimum]